MKRRGRYSVPVSQMNVFAMAGKSRGMFHYQIFFLKFNFKSPNPSLSFCGGGFNPHQPVEENNKGGGRHTKNRTRLFVKGFFFFSHLILIEKKKGGNVQRIKFSLRMQMSYIAGW